MFRVLTFTLLFVSAIILAGCQDGTEPTAPGAKPGENKPQLTRAETAMLEEAAHGNTAAVKGWLEKGVDVNMRGADQNTPIMEAAFAGHIDTVKLLLDYGADLSAKKKDGETVTTLGAGHKDIADLCKSVTILVEAASKGDAKAVKDAIDKGTPVNGLDVHGQSALTEASWNGKTEVVKLLLEKGANPNIKKADGQTPLSLATSQKHQDIVVLLNAAIAKGPKETPKETPATAGK
jgi:ankyrin repeat protein